MICEFCWQEMDGSFGSGRFCNKTCAGRHGHKNYSFSGKTLEEIHGKEKAKQIKEKISIAIKGKYKGKTFEERHGEENAKIIKAKIKYKLNNNNKSKKGKTYEDMYGKEKTKAIKIKQSNSKKGKTYEEIYGMEIALNKKQKRKGKTYEALYGKEKANVIKEKIRKNSTSKRWTKEKIINNLKELGNIKKGDWKKYRKQKLLPDRNVALHYFDSLEEIAEKANIKFKEIKQYNIPNIGKNETHLLDKIENEKNIKLERQYLVAGKYLDGYDPINNIAYEIDELHHKRNHVQDIIRENKIKEILGCNFVRIKDGW